MKNENVVKKSFISSIIFVLIVIIVFYFIFKENNYQEIYFILRQSNKLYLLMALLCMACFSVFEAINIKIILNLLKNKVKFKKCYKYALSGFFVSGITPSSTGGDPMQLYLMSKDNIKVSYGALTLLLKILAYQITIVVLAIIGFIFSHNIFADSLGNLKYIIFLGSFLNILVGSLYFFIIFFKPVIVHIVDYISKILNFFHVKNTENIVNKITKLVNEYSSAADYIKKNKPVLVQVFLNTVFQMI